MTVHFCGLRINGENASECTSASDGPVSSGGTGCGQLSPTCLVAAVIAMLMGMAGKNMSRQSGWLQPLPLSLSRQTDIHTVLWLVSPQILAKPQTSYQSSCPAHTGYCCKRFETCDQPHIALLLKDYNTRIMILFGCKVLNQLNCY